MFALRITTTNLFVSSLLFFALLFTTGTVDGFVVVQQQPSVSPTTTTTTTHRPSTTHVAAVSVPLLDTYAGNSNNAWTKSRSSRINRVLEQARLHQQQRSNKATTTATAAGTTTTTTTPSQTTTNVVLPLPLPTLTTAQIQALEAGEIVMEQAEMGRQGSGFVVQDVDVTDPAAVWNVLLDFERYTERIHTVRSTQVRETVTTQSGDGNLVHVPRATFGIPSTTRASFEVSKFHLQISCILRYRPALNYMELTLDSALQNSALQKAKGVWYTQPVVVNNGRTKKTRVWLLCDLELSPWLPKFIVDCAAASAMPP